MHRILFLPLLAGIAACTTLPGVADSASDGPDDQWRPTTAFKYAASYADAIQVWKTPEDINDWIGARFEYDKPRAMFLSETRRNQSTQVPIYQPRDLFAVPSGVCVDLSRFAVETLRVIDPSAEATYLMVEFAPLTIAGNTLRMHWLASFKRDGKYYFFADSKRPGQIVGPYESAREFIDEYAKYRGREVIAFRELNSFQREQRTMVAKQSRERL